MATKTYKQLEDECASLLYQYTYLLRDIRAVVNNARVDDAAAALYAIKALVKEEKAK
jgi:hypothetical protein